jgi:tetratricopeptide (TPR) repeat protein
MAQRPKLSTKLVRNGYDDCMIRFGLGLIFLAAMMPPAPAGVHYSGETWAELPANWRGYLIDYRSLRSLAVPNPTLPPSPLKERYQTERDRLAALKRSLTADEAADLGALHIRLGAPDKAVEVLRAGLRESKEHYRCASNLGTACQLAGELDQAAAALELAVRLAPAKWKKAEELQLKLVRLRRGEAKQASSLDNLFNVKYTGDPTPPTEMPGDAVSLTQILGLWLPSDGRVLWQLGELAFAHGDTNTGAAILEGCVTEFAMGDIELRRHRQQYRVTADKLTKDPPAGKTDAAASAHAGHGSGSIIRFKSPRPLIRDPLQLTLQPIQAEGLNQLPWPLLAETAFDRPFRVNFHDHLRKLDGKRVVLTGFMQPTGDGLEQFAVLLLEYPVGCWYCELPEPTGLILVLAPEGKAIAINRDIVRVEGRLKLNSKDPEEYLYTITDAKVGPVD